MSSPESLARRAATLEKRRAAAASSRKRPVKLEGATIYFDTSALAKWYLPEPFSDDVATFLQKHAPVAISSLTVLEMRCLLARRRRSRDIDVATERRAFATFDEDVRNGHLVRHELADEMVDGAANLLAIVAEHPLRTLDALHLAVAKRISATVLVTADVVMANAAEALGLRAIRFHTD